MGTIGTAAGRSPITSSARQNAASPETQEAWIGQHGSDISRATTTAVLVLAVVAAAALRLIGGGDQLWYDEILTLVHSVREPLAVIVTHFPSNNDHVFYSVLSHISIVLGGETPLMVRLPAILFGIASIPLIYAVGSRLTTRLEALAAAVLATVAAHHIWFSQNARGYTLLLVATLLGTQLILDGLKTRSKTSWLLFALVSALGAYTHLTMVLAVIGQAIAVALHLLATRRFSAEELKGPAIGFVGAAVVTVMLYLPMLGDVAAFFGDPGTNPEAASAGWAILELFRNLQFGFNSGAILVVGGAVFLVGLISYCRQSPFAVALFFLPPALVYFTAVLMERPTFPRFFFFVAGFLLLVSVRGVFVIIRFVLAKLGGRWLQLEKPMEWTAVAAMAALLLLDLSRSYLKPKMDYEGALAYVEASRRAGDIVALGEKGVDDVYSQYYARDWPRLMNADHLARLRSGQDVLVLHTFERYFSHRDPELFATLKSRCTEERNFIGTLQDGGIHVSRCARRP
jgi:mannosyltransferase